VRESLFSPLWHHVSELRPRLREGVRVQRQKYRDETWYLLVDEANGKQHRVNAPAYEFIGRFDGRSSVNALWSFLLEKFGDAAPGQDDVVRTLQRLAEGELLQLEGAADLPALFRRRAERSRRRRALVNPLAFSIALFDPSRLLARIEPIGLPLLRPATLVLWAALVAAAAVAAAMNWGELRAYAGTHLPTGYFLVLAWVVFPFVKLAHEIGHALALRRWGGEVREFGMSLLFFVPAPYVDASAAGAFRDRRHRLLVSAAGILVETAIGAAALILWLEVEPGLVRDVAFALLFVCLASSVLFNANPLLRFDGYHALCDLIDTPNLGPRSYAYWLHLLRRLLGGDAAAAPAMAAGERKWLAAYAPLSFAYRLALCVALVLWIAEISAFLAWLAAALLAVFVLARPAWETTRALLHAFPEGRARRRAARSIAVAASLALALVFAVPVPHVVTAQGVAWPPDHAQVRAQTEGFVVEVLARDGDRVEPGTPLIALSEPALVSERDALRARLLGLSARQYDAILREPSQARNVIEELERTRTELERVERRIAQWTVRSQAAGRLVLRRVGDLPGSFVAKGTMLAHVLVAAPGVVRVAVPEDRAVLLRGRTARVEIRLAGEPAVPARIVREIPAATRILPSAALGEPAGGRHLVDPADRHGTLALEPVLLFDVALERPLDRLGQRAWVRFHLGSEPLAVQWQRRARQLFLRHFNPVT
jgi:putative peptide zinc metalloprotease protein